MRPDVPKRGRVGEAIPLSFGTPAGISVIVDVLPEQELVLRRINYHSRLRRVISYLKVNATEPLSLRDAAKIACMERTAFSRFFNRAVGLTFREFLQRWRIAIAAEQLLNSDRPVTDIAYSTGFTSVSAFERTFKKLTSLTPSQYRKLALNGFASVGQQSPKNSQPLTISGQ